MLISNICIYTVFYKNAYIFVYKEKKLNGSTRKGKQMSGEVTTETAVFKHNL